MSYEFGDVVLLPFPFTNLDGSKKRPAVIVSGVGYNNARRDVVAMAITSQLRDLPVFGEVRIADWQAGGLLKPSAVKPVFVTIEHALIIRRLGKLAELDRHALTRSLDEILGQKTMPNILP